MFRIITNHAIEDCVQLERCVSQFAAENMEIEAAIRELSTLSGMEEVLLHLNGIYARMQEEADILRQMMQGLDRTVQCYVDFENRICGNAEQGTIRHVRRKVRMNDFSQILGLMEEIL